MGKVFTRFQTKTAQKPYPMGRHLAIWLIYGSIPQVFVITSGQIQIGTRLALILHAAGQDLVLLPSLWLIWPVVFFYWDFNIITSLHVSGVHWGECGVTSRCFSCSHLLAPSSKQTTRWQTIICSFSVVNHKNSERTQQDGKKTANLVWQAWQ